MDTEEKDRKLATTLLAVMVKCFFTGKTFLVALIPCHALNAEFLFKTVSDTIKNIENCQGKVWGLIWDNNRINQKCSGMFTIKEDAKPWIVNNPVDPDRPLFLLYDTVHLLKNLRNNWLTEKVGILQYMDISSVSEIGTDSPPPIMEAKWSDLKTLHKYEERGMLKMSKLTGPSVSPSSIEKQKVSLALNVFCEQTAAALVHSTCTEPSSKVTSRYILMILQLWKLWNCKSKVEANRMNDSDRIPIDNSPAGARGLKLLRDWAKLATWMTHCGKYRVQKLTRDTGKALHWTCLCLADFSEFLLTTNTSVRHDYVLLGFFQQDDLESHFGHFRMASGWNFYITVEDVMATHSLDKAKLMLKYCESIPDGHASHQCDLCDNDLCEEEILILDDLPSDIEKLSQDERLNLFYIAGYAAFRNPEFRGNPSDDDFGADSAFLDETNRGGLSYPSKALFEIVMLGYIFFLNTPVKLCRSRFVTIVLGFPAMFHVDIMFIKKDPIVRIANILMKKYSQKMSIKKGKKVRPNQKIIKLSSL